MHSTSTRVPARSPVARLLRMIVLNQSRRATQRALRHLDDRLLRDIGLIRSDLESFSASRRPLTWQAARHRAPTHRRATFMRG